MKINNIQALRALAALLVAYFHLSIQIGSFKPVGSFGVEIFFVISGFIMARISVVSPERFFVRRLIRILPLYWGCTLLLFFAAEWVPQYFHSTRPELGELLKSLFFIPFEKEPGRMQPLLFLGWTLNYEMLFYALTAASLMISRKYATLLVSILLALMMALCAEFSSSSQIAWFYSRPIMGGFVLGVAVFWLSQVASEARAKRYGPVLFILAAASLAALVLSEGFGILDTDITRTLLSTLLVGSVVLLSKSGRDTQLWPLILIGDASYSLYLLHPYVEGFFHFILRQAVDPRRPLGLILVLASTIAAAIIVYLTLERPITTKLNSLLRRSRSPATPLPMRVRT